jgi:hypothetical protein
MFYTSMTKLGFSSQHNIATVDYHSQLDPEIASDRFQFAVIA